MKSPVQGSELIQQDSSRKIESGLHSLFGKHDWTALAHLSPCPSPERGGDGNKGAQPHPPVPAGTAPLRPRPGPGGSRLPLLKEQGRDSRAPRNPEEGPGGRSEMRQGLSPVPGVWGPCPDMAVLCKLILGGFLYLYGGRNTTSLRDFWRYNIVKNEWEMLDCSRDGPEELEEHSMVAYKGILCIFGGMVDSAFTQAKIPLWIYDTDSARWTECRTVPAETESSAPANRKGHSAVVYQSSMYIYGGYFGIRGISQEFWTFHFDTRRWECVSSPSRSPGPGPRHGHSAVVYRTGMYLFGGLMGLSEQKDFWRWDFVSSSWSSLRTR
ncbi:actin-fragmin kinase-like [Columba livia]|uniref:Actin-fragmin kinase-like n=1 Tax=Columba livia TaxID=8932 RepID=A0A2I0MGJ9_COLLI|nr:actin-fragmin kinase-like [Columba livia]